MDDPEEYEELSKQELSDLEDRFIQAELDEEVRQKKEQEALSRRHRK